MSKDPSAGDRINAVVTGPVQGEVAIGKDISQQQEVGSMQLALSDAEKAELNTLFANHAKRSPPPCQSHSVAQH
jgi:hypothetical protein